jgi:hypothetical protein
VTIWLTEHPDLVPVPPIDPGAVELHPEDFPTWTAMFDAHPGLPDYLLHPGDYRHWGILTLRNQPGGSSDRPATIRYFDPDRDDDVHPVKLPRGSWARIESVQFALPETHDWLVQGLTMSSPSAYPSISQGASRITIDYCLIEYAQTYSLRIRQATDCTVQRCVIRKTIRQNLPQDTVGIQVGNINADVTGIRILDNEIYDVGDGIQLTDGPSPERPVEVVIEGNDIYLDSSRYIAATDTTWDENAIDLKAGSDAPESTRIRRNRMWGFRRNAAPTALGELIVVQRYSRNVLIEDNILGEAPRGMKDENWLDGDLNRPRNVVFKDNQFYEIRDYAPQDAGAVTRPITSGVAFIGNYFARCEHLADANPSAYRGSGPIYTDNVLIEVTAIQRPEAAPRLVLQPENRNVVMTAPYGFEEFERKRWTIRELVPGAKPADTAHP